MVDWMKRHLNWTLILYYPAVFAFACIMAYPLEFLFGEFTAWVGKLMGYISIIGFLFLGRWVLQQKGRSGWWLVLFFTPISFLSIIIWCLLGNKSKRMEVSESKSD